MKPQDSIQYAAELGRLDLVSLLLTIVSIILACGGVFAFFSFRELAKRHAKEEAIKIANETAENAANIYLQRELPHLIEAYKSFLHQDDVTDELANNIADAQDNHEDKT